MVSRLGLFALLTGAFWAAILLIPYKYLGPVLIVTTTVIAVSVVLSYRHYARSALQSKEFDYADRLVLGIMFAWAGLIVLEIRSISTGVFGAATPVIDAILVATIFAWNIIGGMLHLTARYPQDKSKSNRDVRRWRWVVLIRTFGLALVLGLGYMLWLRTHDETPDPPPVPQEVPPPPADGEPITP